MDIMPPIEQMPRDLIEKRLIVERHLDRLHDQVEAFVSAWERWSTDLDGWLAQLGDARFSPQGSGPPGQPPPEPIMMEAVVAAMGVPETIVRVDSLRERLGQVQADPRRGPRPGA